VKYTAHCAISLEISEMYNRTTKHGQYTKLPPGSHRRQTKLQVTDKDTA